MDGTAGFATRPYRDRARLRISSPTVGNIRNSSGKTDNSRADRRRASDRDQKKAFVGTEQWGG